MWKRFAMVTGIVVVCAIAAVITFALWQSQEGKPFNLVTKSSAATYRAELSERVEIYDFASAGHGHHEVTLTLRKGTKSLIENELLYEGGVYDDRFSTLFPDHNWISDSTLRFGGKDERPQSQYDEVTVVNETNRIVTYLWLNSGKYELFLFFELHPASSVTLHVQPQTDEGQDSSYLGCKGKFDNGEAIREVAANFDIRQKYRSPAHYSVRVTDTGVLIASKEFGAIP